MYNHEGRESQNLKPFHKRLNYLLIFVFIIFIGIIFRLSYVQIIKGNQYYEQAAAKSDKYIPIPAMRGKIYAREGGNPVVYSRGSSTAIFTESEKMKKSDFVDLATKLESVLGLSRSEILKKMDVGYVYHTDTSGNLAKDANGNLIVDSIARSTQRFLDKDLKIDLNDKEIAYLSEHRDEFPGVSVIVKPIRVYDSRQVAVQAIGYVRPYNLAISSPGFLFDFYQGKDSIYTPNQMVGFDGLEYTYEEQLRGENGKRYFQVSADGTVQNQLNEVAPVSGNDLYLTIDSRIQTETQDYIKGYLPQIRQLPGAEGSKNVYAVAMEVKTGKVIADISYPGYDPNLWVKGVSPDVYEQIRNYVTNGTIQSANYDVSPLTGTAATEEAAKHPQSIVPTGSTIKPATELMGLGEGVISTNDVWQDPAGGYKYGSGSDVVHNDKNHNYGTLTPQRALQKSANTYMARIGNFIWQKYKANSIYILEKYFHAFGLGVKTGVDLPNENQGIQDFITTNATVSPLAAMVQASFGQQERFTAMQLCQYVATVANNGKRLQPQMVDKIVSPQGKVIQQFQPKIMNQINLPDDIWKTVQEGMFMVTQGDGTAAGTVGGLSYHVAAKTGTSDQDIYYSVKDANGTVTHVKGSVANGVFIAYAPVENPKLALAIVVPQGGYGGTACGYIAKKLFDSYDHYYGLNK